MPARMVTVRADAFVLHQLVRRARHGVYGGFDHIVIGGFSAGGAVAIKEASIYRDADAVLVEDFMHTAGPALPGLAASLHDARTDPVIDRPNLPAGYVTTRPGTRENVFIAPAFAEPKLVKLDEQTKSINSAAELAGVGAVLRDRALSRRVNVPVLLVQGQLDPFFCSDPTCSALRKESAFYGPAAHLKKVLVPSAAHAVNEHRVAPLLNRIVARWTYHSSLSR
jgi:pimeloyl-ACP methyl ester carboxylesterase